MTFWILAGLLSAGIVLFLVLPLLKREEAIADAHPDLAVYRDQLAELERELARGLLPESEAAAARLEIQRRLLAAAGTGGTGPQAAGSTRSRLAVILVLLLPLAAAAIYLDLGSPSLPALPYASRTPVSARDQELAQLVDRLGQRMKAHPEDPRGWVLLGDSLNALGRYAESASAYGNAIARLQATNQPVLADLESRYGEALSAAADGEVTPAAKAAFAAALAIDAKDPRARFYLGLADSQAGQLESALARWVALEADSPADAPWRASVTVEIEATAKKLGRDPATLPGRKPPPVSAPGPSAEDMARAATMSPAERSAFIDSMVAGLAARLKDHPEDVDGWLRLGNAYDKLGKPEDALAAWREAAMRAPDRLDAQTAFAAAAAAKAEQGPLPAEFEATVARIQKLAPDNPLALYCTGLIAVAHGDKAAARSAWQKLLPLMPTGSPQRQQLEARIAALGT